MGARYRRQEETRIEISGGDWLIVRKHLTAGEQRGAHARLIKAGTFTAGERPQLDPEKLGIAQACAYLLDWSITDVEDKPIRIRDQPFEFIEAALNAQEPESLAEILRAIDTHDTAMAAAREQEKKVPTGVPAS
jgi:hypothetical protein